MVRAPRFSLSFRVAEKGGLAMTVFQDFPSKYHVYAQDCALFAAADVADVFPLVS